MVKAIGCNPINVSSNLTSVSKKLYFLTIRSFCYIYSKQIYYNDNTKRKNLGIALLTEKIQRISGKKVVLEDEARFLKKRNASKINYQSSLHERMR